MTRTFLQLCQAGRRNCFTVWSWWEPDCPSWRGYWPLQHLHQVIFCDFLRNSASSFHWLSSSIFTNCRSSFGCPASVTPPLISTIWCFRPYKPYFLWGYDPGNVSASYSQSYTVHSEFRILVRCLVCCIFLVCCNVWKYLFVCKYIAFVCLLPSHVCLCTAALVWEKIKLVDLVMTQRTPIGDTKRAKYKTWFIFSD